MIYPLEPSTGSFFSHWFFSLFSWQSLVFFPEPFSSTVIGSRVELLKDVRIQTSLLDFHVAMKSWKLLHHVWTFRRFFGIFPYFPHNCPIGPQKIGGQKRLLNWFLCWRYGHIAPGDGCCDLATRIFGPIHIGSIHLDPPFLKDYSYWIDLQKIAISPSFFDFCCPSRRCHLCWAMWRNSPRCVFWLVGYHDDSPDLMFRWSRPRVYISVTNKETKIPDGDTRGYNEPNEGRAPTANSNRVLGAFWWSRAWFVLPQLDGTGRINPKETLNEPQRNPKETPNKLWKNPVRMYI